MQESLSEVKSSLKSCALYDLAQRRLFMIVFTFSQFGYCPLVWMFDSRKLNNRISNTHEHALEIVYRDYQSTFHRVFK